MCGFPSTAEDDRSTWGEDKMAACTTTGLHVFEKNACIRGYHVYGSIWIPTEEEKLQTKQEFGNVMDRYAVALLKDDVVVGHVPREMSKTVWNFLKHGGSLYCEVTDSKRRYSQVAGGLEIECKLVFSSRDPLLMGRLQQLLA